MKTFIKSNPAADLGYEVVVVNDDGTTNSINVLGVKDGYIHLPQNPSGREWVTVQKIEKHEGELELIPREKRILGPRNDSPTKVTQKTTWIDVLTEDELKIFNELKSKAEKRLKRKAIEDEMATLTKRLQELNDEEGE